MEFYRSTIGEQLQRAKIAFDRIRPIKTKSLAEFIATLQLGNASQVEAGPYVFSEQVSFGSDGGFMFDFDEVGKGYGSEYIAINTRGRKIKLDEYYGYIAKNDLRSPKVYDAAVLRALITTNRNLRQIEKYLPGISTVLTSPLGTIDDRQRAQLDEADRYDVPSFPLKPLCISPYFKELSRTSLPQSAIDFLDYYTEV